MNPNPKDQDAATPGIENGSNPTPTPTVLTTADRLLARATPFLLAGLLALALFLLLRG